MTPTWTGSLPADFLPAESLPAGSLLPTSGAEQAVTSFAPDQAVAEWFLGLALDHPVLVDVGEVLALALHPWVFRVAVVGTAVLLWRAGNQRGALVSVATMAFGGALGLALKLAIRRPRPVWGDPVAAELGYSMPSGHALNAALGSVLLVVVAWPWLRARGRTGQAVAVAAVVVLVTMLDRMVLGVHYLSDVLVGASLGTALALAAARLVRRGTGAGSRTEARRGPGARRRAP